MRPSVRRKPSIRERRNDTLGELTDQATHPRTTGIQKPPSEEAPLSSGTSISHMIIYGFILLMVVHWMMDPLPTLSELKGVHFSRFARPVEVYFDAHSLVSQVAISFSVGLSACMMTYLLLKLKEFTRSI